jgi:glutathione-independent formaldehyde dehydrogenase
MPISTSSNSPIKDQALEKIEDLTLLSDIFPTSYDGAVKVGVTTGSIVYVAGAGPVGLGCAAACQLLGAAVVIVGDMISERLAQARSFGCETIDLRERIPLGERIAQMVGVPEVDSAVDCVGFEAKGQAEQAGTEQPATVLNWPMEVTRAGGAIGIFGLYVTDDPGAKDANAKHGVLGIRIGLGWAKSHSFGTGQCPVLRYNRQLMMAIQRERLVLQRTWAPPTGPFAWLKETNAQVIGKRDIITAFISFVLGGIEALLIRIQLARPENRFLNPDLYDQIFTLHGSTMMFLYSRA